MNDSRPYGYDPATDTVRVSRHDLHRLLLQFRIELERRGADHKWHHMADFDKSFERLAEAVNYAVARSRPALAAVYGGGPDHRMRCKRIPPYTWPDHAPYDGHAVQAVHVKDGQSRRDCSSHYVTWERRGFGRTLCGFRLTLEEPSRSRVSRPARNAYGEEALAASPEGLAP